MPCKSYFTNFVFLGSFYCRNTFDLSYVFNILYGYHICQQHLNTFGSSLDTKKFL